ncbi:STE3-like pheromone receptor [Pluteus cervinus]|uniref:STE3-like pheromone receptor n=1 Tax=Pluteus cervinus TaxID=181527 RepID=A0ACD3AIW4_9AGAR|nr:STE3-like pheromone receptor [Pluteus cervinus]
MRSYDPTFPLFPVLTFIGFVISLIPLPWHAQAWNSGTCAFMIWTSTMCLIYFINSLVWAGNLVNIAPVWCDITSKLMIGASAGFPASILCISRRLYHITAVQTVSVTRRDKRRMVLIDLCISLGIPVLVMILHVVVQGHRFDIFEDFGCFAVTYNTLPAYFLVDMWPILLASISFVYSSLTLRSFWARRAQFHDLAASNSALSMSRYIRLMLLAFLDIMLTLPLSVFTFYMGTKGHVQPWISWEDTHYDFGRVGKFASIVWMGNPNTRVPVEMTRWLPVLCAYVFFALFGFASEAQKHYARVFNAALKLVGYKRSPIAKKAPLPS